MIKFFKILMQKLFQLSSKHRPELTYLSLIFSGPSHCQTSIARNCYFACIETRGKHKNDDESDSDDLWTITITNMNDIHQHNMMMNMIIMMNISIMMNMMVQSTPVISRLLGAKICERELSDSPVISREGHDSRLPGSQTHIHDIFWRLQISKQYVER